MRKHRLGTRALFALTIALALLLVVFINGIFLLLSNRYNLAVDLTRSAAFQLDPDSLKLLDNLDQEITIDVLAREDSFEGNPYLVQARRILQQYPKQSPYISLRFIDYQQNPAFGANYPDISLSPGNILVKGGSNIRQLQLQELFNYDLNTNAVVSSRAQEALSSAILQVASGKALRAAILTGADTADAQALYSLLGDNNIKAAQVNLVTGALLDYDICFLLSPMVDLSLQTLKKLDDYLYNDGAFGKALFVSLDASQPLLPNLSTYLKEWGVALLDGAVFETTASRTYAMQPFYPLTEYSEDRLSGKLRDSQIPLLLPRAKPFQLLFASRDNQHTRELLRFSDTSGVRPSQAGSDFDPARAALKGPLPAMAQLIRQGKGQAGQAPRSSIVLSASTAMLEAGILQNSQLANGEYLLKMVDDLTGRDQVVHIRPVSLASARLGVNSLTARWLGILLIGVLPGLLLIAGLAVFLYRRYQ